MDKYNDPAAIAALQRYQVEKWDRDAGYGQPDMFPNPQAHLSWLRNNAGNFPGKTFAKEAEVQGRLDRQRYADSVYVPGQTVMPAPLAPIPPRMGYTAVPPRLSSVLDLSRR